MNTWECEKDTKDSGQVLGVLAKNKGLETHGDLLYRRSCHNGERTVRTFDEEGRRHGLEVYTPEASSTKLFTDLISSAD